MLSPCSCWTGCCPLLPTLGQVILIHSSGQLLPDLLTITEQGEGHTYCPSALWCSVPLFNIVPGSENDGEVILRKMKIGLDFIS